MSEKPEANDSHESARTRGDVASSVGLAVTGVGAVAAAVGAIGFTDAVAAIVASAGGASAAGAIGIVALRLSRHYLDKRRRAREKTLRE